MSDVESTPSSKAGHVHDNKSKECLDISQLPRAKGWRYPGVTLYQGCWLPSDIPPNIISFQQKFQALDQDIILASNPKSGTTWLKSLGFSILNRHLYEPSNSPLLTTNPHQLVPFFEFSLFADPPTHDLGSMTQPRLFATHLPYELLTDEIKRSEPHSPRIVYVCRNPLDTIVSFWHFVKQSPRVYANQTLEELVETFCKGESNFGPYWRHVLGYWKASLENPEKVMFLKYENMLEDSLSHVKRFADFMGFPFSDEEESAGVAEQIVQFCSLGNLKELDVNKHGKGLGIQLDNKVFFRKGQVGDWVNHLSPSMVEKVEKVVQENLRDSGLSFRSSRS